MSEERSIQEIVDELIEGYQKERGTVIGLLQDVNEHFRYLPKEALHHISSRLGIPVSKLYTLATFYKSFRLKPVGRHLISVCMGTACHVNGSPRILDTLERDLGIKAGETTSDNRFTLETVNCLGACALGPLVVIDGEYYGKMTQSKLKKVIKKYSSD